MTRSRFLSLTYLHLFAAIAAVVALEVTLFRSGLAERMASVMGRVPWLLILGAFILIGWLARHLAHRVRTLTAQYLGLIAYVLAKAVILVPLLYRAESVAPGALAHAGWITLLGACGLTLVALWTGRDFSFLRALLIWGGMTALLTIVAALLFGLRLGIWFDLGMIALAGASILYDTSKLSRRYRGSRGDRSCRSSHYVAAALELFASVALMFWYAVRLFRRQAWNQG